MGGANGPLADMEVNNPAQKVSKQAVQAKVRWDLKLTDRQKVVEFVE